METQKGSSSFNMHLARVSIDGEDEPIGRQATLRLSTQQEQTTLLNTNRQLMEIYIDGRLMASWDFALLEQHPYYQTIHIFSSFAIGKHIHMTLPLPLGSRAAVEKNVDCLKAIRVYFSKAQDFHTAINWLSKHAQLIHLNGRPATSNACHTSTPGPRKASARPDVRWTMASSASPSASQDRGQSGGRPQSLSEQSPVIRYNEQPKGQPRSLANRPPPPQYLRQSGSRRQRRVVPQQMPHGLHGQLRESDLRRNLFALQDADRPATALPSTGGYGSAATRAGYLQMPRVLETPSIVTSAMPMGYKLQPLYDRSNQDVPDAASYSVTNAPTSQHSPYSARNHSCGPPSHEPLTESHMPGGSGLYLGPGPSIQRAPSRLSQSSTLAMMSTQSTPATDSMGVDLPHSYADGSNDALRRRRVESMAPPGAMALGASPGQLNSDWHSITSSQKRRMSAIPHTASQQTPHGPEIPPASLFAAAALLRQHSPEQDTMADSDGSFPRPYSAASQRQPLTELEVINMSDPRVARQECSKEGKSRKDQGQPVRQKRPTSAQAGPRKSEKKSKANQSAPMQTANRWADGSNKIDNDSFSVANEAQKEAAALATVAPSLFQMATACSVKPSKDTQMVDHAVQTEAISRIQVDALHLSAFLDLNQRLLQETTHWENMDHWDERLSRLGLQFVQGLRIILSSA